ncbi:hypothetical protein FQA47_015670 [Oryzias melastigma]|uniref:Uncharacterized protein n=1 Tax=Oryzias melastigma TaxID=30732 RepID=A0A834F9W1_ORYME|nr:hypothetical protein FQA47_015670 [Oryzias melastigma]
MSQHEEQTDFSSADCQQPEASLLTSACILLWLTLKIFSFKPRKKVAGSSTKPGAYGREKLSPLYLRNSHSRVRNVVGICGKFREDWTPRGGHFQLNLSSFLILTA